MNFEKSSRRKHKRKIWYSFKVSHKIFENQQSIGNNQKSSKPSEIFEKTS